MVRGACTFGEGCRYRHVVADSHSILSIQSDHDSDGPSHFDFCTGPQENDFGRINSPCVQCNSILYQNLDRYQLSMRDSLILQQDDVFAEESANLTPQQTEDVRDDLQYFQKTRQRGNAIHSYTIACLSHTLPTSA